MAIVGEVTTVFKGDAKNLEQTVSKASQALNGFSQRATAAVSSVRGMVASVNETGSAFASLAIKAGAVFVAFKAFQELRGSVAAFSEQERAVRQLNLALANQGNLLPGTSKSLQDFASSLQKVTTYGDEVILKNQAILASFGLTEQQLKQATPIVLDFASAMGMDLQAAMTLVGKAAVGETGTLSRYGIIIDENVPKTEKFAAVLAQLEQRFKGSATALTKDYVGGMQQLKNAWGDVQEAWGGLMTQLASGSGQMKDVVIGFLQDITTFISRDMTLALANIRAGILQMMSGILSAYSKAKSFMGTGMTSLGVYLGGSNPAGQMLMDQGLAMSQGSTAAKDLAESLDFASRSILKEAADAINGRSANEELARGINTAGAAAQVGTGQVNTLVQSLNELGAKSTNLGAGALDHIISLNSLGAQSYNLGTLTPGITSNQPQTFQDIFGDVYGTTKVNNLTDEATKSTFDWSSALQSVANMYTIIGGNADSTFGRLLGSLGQVMSATQGIYDALQPGGGGATYEEGLSAGAAALPGIVGAMRQGPAQGALAGGAAGFQLTGGNPLGALIGGVVGGIGGLMSQGGADRDRREAEARARHDELMQMQVDSMGAFEDIRSQIEEVWGRIMDEAVSGLGAVFTWMGEQGDLTAERLDAMGVVGVAVFQSLRNHGMSVVDAVRMMGPALQEALKAAQENGIELGGTFAELAGYFDLISQNEGLVNAVQGMGDVLDALAATGNLTQESFNNVQAELQNMYASLIEQGFTADQALALMAPALLAAQEAAERYGFQLDEATQAQINMAEEAGLFDGLKTDQEQMVEVLQLMLGVLAAIGAAFGVELPAAVQEYINSLRQIPTLPGEAPVAPPGSTPYTPNTGDPSTYGDTSSGSYVPPGVPSGGGQAGFYSPSMPYGPGPHGESYLPVHPGENVSVSPAGAGASISINAPVSVTVQGGGDPQAIADAVSQSLEQNLSGRLTAAIRDAAAT